MSTNPLGRPLRAQGPERPDPTHRQLTIASCFALLVHDAPILSLSDTDTELRAKGVTMTPTGIAIKLDRQAPTMGQSTRSVSPTAWALTDCPVLSPIITEDLVDAQSR